MGTDYRPLCSCRSGCLYCEAEDVPLEPEGHWLLGQRRPASPFADELRRAMAERGWTCKALGPAIGVSPQSVVNYRRGSVRPMLATARRLADVLDWPSLLTLAVELRRRGCAICRRPFTERAKHPSRYCSDACRTTAWRRQARGQNRQLERIGRRRLAQYQDAIEAYCRGCSPDLVCRVADCPLRALSPLPLVESVARVPHGTPQLETAGAEVTGEPSARGRRPDLSPATHPGETITKAYHGRWW